MPGRQSFTHSALFCNHCQSGLRIIFFIRRPIAIPSTSQLASKTWHFRDSLHLPRSQPYNSSSSCRAFRPSVAYPTARRSAKQWISSLHSHSLYGLIIRGNSCLSNIPTSTLGVRLSVITVTIVRWENRSTPCSSLQDESPLYTSWTSDYPTILYKPWSALFSGHHL